MNELEELKNKIEELEKENKLLNEILVEMKHDLHCMAEERYERYRVTPPLDKRWINKYGITTNKDFYDLPYSITSIFSHYFYDNPVAFEKNKYLVQAELNKYMTVMRQNANN